MITKTNIAIAEALAVSTTKDLSLAVSPVVVALNNQLGGALPFTDATYQQEVIANSNTNGDYTNTFDNVSDIMSGKIRDIFEQIRVYAKPLSGKLSDVVSATLADNYTARISGFLMSDVELEFIKIDHPFFSSLYYPTTKSNSGLTFKDYRETDLAKVVFSDWDSRRIIEWLDVDNPEIKKLLMSSEVDLTAALTGLSDFYSLPFELDYDKRSIDFTRPRLTKMNTIFVQYILLAKMANTEEPFEGIVSGSLNDYRRLVKVLFDAYTEALVSLKAEAMSLSSVPFRIVELTPHSKREVIIAANVTPITRSKVKANVFYNTTGLDMCVESKTTFAEVAVAYFFTKYIGLDAAKATTYLSNFTEAKLNFNRIVSSLSDMVNKNTANILNGAISRTVAEYIDNSPELDEIVKAGFGGDVNKLVQAMFENTNYGTDIYYYHSKESMSISAAIDQSNLINNFLEYIGCKEAAAILRDVKINTNLHATDVDQRKVLTVAVIKHLVRTLFTNK